MRLKLAENSMVVSLQNVVFFLFAADLKAMNHGKSRKPKANTMMAVVSDSHKHHPDKTFPR